MSRVMALDIGTRRIGVATSDEAGLIAQPLTVIIREGTVKDVAAIVRMVREQGVQEVVVGRPVALRGEETESTRKVLDFVDRLRDSVKVPVVMVDERLSTVEASRRMLEADVRRGERRQRVDAVAAALILERYLNSRRGG